MTAPVGDELRAAIRAAPDDRALRLVYADWLMERGDPRGEWIALSCGQDSEDTEREMRRRALWQHYGRQWESEDRVYDSLVEISYRDGFPDTATLAQPIPHQLVLHPLRALDVDVGPGVLGALAASPLLDTVRRLHLCGDIADVSEDDLVAFLNTPALARLEELAISTGIGGARALWPALARFSRLAELKHLELDARLDADHARWLGRFCPALQMLGCQGGFSSDAALRALGEPAAFRLRALDLYFHGDRDRKASSRSDAAIADVIASPLTCELTSLGLFGAAFGGDTAAALGRLPCAATLRELRVSALDDAAIVRRLHDGRFPALETLRLTSAAVTDELVGVVAQLPTLTELVLDSAAITRVGAERIMSSLPRLERLGLHHTPLGDDGAHAIASSPRARSLRQLWLHNAGLRRGGVASLVDSSHLHELRGLALRDNPLDRDAVRALADGPFDRMARLGLGYTFDARLAPLFADAWLQGADAGTYERKLELSGRAVPRTPR